MLHSHSNVSKIKNKNEGTRPLLEDLTAAKRRGIFLNSFGGINTYFITSEFDDKLY